MVSVSILRKREDFTRLRTVRPFNTDGFSLRTAPASDSMKEGRDTVCRVGITVSKYCSKKAVERNRIKRRLRRVIAQTWPELAHAGHDYVVIARVAALTMPYARLCADAQRGLKKLHAP